MKLETQSLSVLAREAYDKPKVAVLPVEPNETLAKSNIETIVEDDEEYGWV